MGAAVNSSYPPIGALLREWRAARRMSQLDLALEAGMSARHLSCVETGKSQASRETVANLANALGMPLREHNLLMLAAGFAPQFSETPLDTSALERMNEAIELILRHQEPYPAFVINRHWEILLRNQAGARIVSSVMGGRPLRHKNMLHNVFDPEDFRPVIVNWTDIAGWYIRHLHEEIAASPSDQGSRQLLKEILAYPGVPRHWRFRDVDSEVSPVLNLVYRSSAGQLRFFETITTFAGPRDITLDELRIECFFPADEKTTDFCARLAHGEL
jgi:transcriptional regulator with XRE-family HTH domain